MKNNMNNTNEKVHQYWLCNSIEVETNTGFYLPSVLQVPSSMLPSEMLLRLLDKTVDFWTKLAITSDLPSG